MPRQCGSLKITELDHTLQGCEQAWVPGLLWMLKSHKRRTKIPAIHGCIDIVELLSCSPDRVACRYQSSTIVGERHSLGLQSWSQNFQVFQIKNYNVIQYTTIVYVHVSYERTPATRSFFRIPPAPLRRGRGVPRAKHPGHGPSNRGVALDLTRLVKKEQTREKGITTTFENNGLDSPSTGVFWHVAPNERRQG